jgi:hypothetical protein
VWHQLIRNHVFKDAYHSRPLDEVVERIRRYTPEINKLRAYIQNDYKKLCYKHSWLYEPDDRSGDETYGYKSIAQVNADLEYISDRFRSDFRLAWLVDVPNRITGLPEKSEEDKE